MKKIQALLISMLFLITNNIQASFLQNPNPYSFGPQGRSVSDLREFAKPKHMARILPNRPVAATDSEGNRVYYTPDGKMTLSVGKDGSMSFSLGGVSKSYNSSGDFSGITRTLRGSGLLQEVRDKHERFLGYKVLNGEGKISRTYDKDGNLSATYVYTGQGATLDYVQNEKTKGRTYYDEYQRAKYEVDMDGFIVKTYQYEDVSYIVDEDDVSRRTLKVIEKKGDKGQGLLVTSKDYSIDITRLGSEDKDMFAEGVFSCSTTFYDKEGKTLYIKNSVGEIATAFFYKQDDKGNKILDYMLDNKTKNKTYFDEHGSKKYTKNDEGFIVTRYFDDYSVNYNISGGYEEVTRYDIDGKELYTTIKHVTYNSDGTIDQVLDEGENVIEQYYYRTDSEGNKIIDYVEDCIDHTKTYYDDEQRQQYTKNSDGDIIKEYGWNGNTLVYIFDARTQLTEYYNMNKEKVYIAFNERLVSKNLYSKGKLVAKWDTQNNQVTIYVNERPWIVIATNEEPDAGMVDALVTHAAEINKEIFTNGDGSLLDSLLIGYGWKASSSDVKKVDNQ